MYATVLLYGYGAWWCTLGGGGGARPHGLRAFRKYLCLRERKLSEAGEKCTKRTFMICTLRHIF
jgi:hypothetical protein